MIEGHHLQGGRLRGWRRPFGLFVLVVCAFLVTSTGAAFAYWSAAGSGGATAKATTASTGAQPTATVSGRDVTLSWGAATNATSYTVARANVAPQSLSTTVNGTCAGGPTGTSCTDTSLVESGASATNWTYIDTPQLHNWNGTTSPASAQVTVPAPTQSITTNSFTVAGGTTSATVSNYFDNEVVSYCIDNDLTTTCPSADKAVPATVTVPATGGTLTTSTLTIPSGLSVGTHTLFAKGSLGSNPAGVSFSITKATPTITSAAQPASVTVGGSATDQATVSNGVSLSNGTITWKLYASTDATCTGTVFFTSTAQMVAANTTFTSSSFTTTAVGGYKWAFYYTGDANNNAVSACGGTNEALTVNQATPTLGTSASTNVTVRQSVTDTATLANGSNPTGTVTYTLYGPSATASCVTPVGQVTKTVSGNGAYVSPVITPAQAGTYWWIANYGGDGNNAVTTNTCGATGESSVVNKATPTIVTTATPATVTVGGSVADQSVFSNGFSPTGTLTWSLFKGTACTGTAVFTTTTGGTVGGNSTYTSNSFTVPTTNNSAGTYTWQVSYGGDTNNNALAATCGGTGQTVTASLAITPTTLTSGTVATAYNKTVAAAGGNGTYTYSATGLPAGLTIGTSSGTISGTPTAGGTFNVTVSVHDSASPQNTGSQAYTLTIGAPTIALSTLTLPTGTVAQAYSGATITASGGTSPYTYSATGLPAGLAISATTGAISGTPTAGGSFSVSVTATDHSTGSGPYSGSKTYPLTINAPTITVSPTSLPNGTVNVAYGTQTFGATGGTSPYTYAVSSGTQPPGLTLTSGGVLTGTPTAAGSYSFSVTATDSSTGTGAPYSGSQSYTVQIGAAPTSCTGTYSLGAYTTVQFTAIGGGGGTGANGSRGTGGSGAAGAEIQGTLTNPTSSAVSLTCAVGKQGTDASGTTHGTGGTGDASGGSGGSGSSFFSTTGGGAGGGGGASAILLSGSDVVDAGGGGGGGGGGGSTGSNGASATVNTTVSATGGDNTGKTGGNSSNEGGAGGGGGAGVVVAAAASGSNSSSSGGGAGGGGSSYDGGAGSIAVGGASVGAGGNAGNDGSISFSLVSGLVQVAGGTITSNSSKSLSFSFGQATTAGDLIVVHAIDPTGGAITISDGANTYTTHTVTLSTSGTATDDALAFAGNAASVTTITVRTPSNSRIAASAAEFAGFSTVDDSSSGVSTFGGTSVSSGTATPSNADDLLIGAAGWSSGTRTLGSVTAGFVDADDEQSFSVSEILSYNIVSSTGSYHFGGTLSGSTPWAAFIYAFQ